MAPEDLVLAIPKELLNQAGWLITILQAVGVFVILYIVYYVVMTIINRKRLRILDEMNQHLIEIKEILKKQR